MDQEIDVQKVNGFNLLKEEVEEFGHQYKTLESEGRRLEHLVET